MTYRIKLHAPASLNFKQQLRAELRQAIQALDMTVELQSHPPATQAKRVLGGSITLHKVRFIKSREFCGSHPNACDNPELQPPRRNTALEGSDWALCNDAVCDVLDAHQLSADVSSSQVVIRIGTRRRVHYSSSFNTQLNAWVWDMKGTDAMYEDWCGRQAPRATVPFGTPGQRDFQIYEGDKQA